MGSGQSTPAPPPLPAKLGATPEAFDVKKPKPCCVCLDEKAKRDECMLFSASDNAQTECADLVTKYKDCMGSYGFKI